MTGTLHRAMLNRYALGTALALVVAPLAGIGSAEAACSPASGQDNATVTCDSNTTNQDSPNGFGQGTENGVTLTVNSGVAVTGSKFGLSLNNNNTITIQNGASVTGTGATGIVVGDGSTITNSGAISGFFLGVGAVGNLTLHNSSTIAGGDIGVGSQSLTLDNSNSITGSVDGISAHIANVTSNSGTISGGSTGIQAVQAIVANNVNGLIEATGSAGVGIGGFGFGNSTVVTLDNAGSVLATDPGGIALQGLTVTVNSNTGAISSDAFGINATGTAIVKNGIGGTITAAAANGIAIGDSNQAGIRTPSRWTMPVRYLRSVPVEPPFGGRRSTSTPTPATSSGIRLPSRRRL